MKKIKYVDKMTECAFSMQNVISDSRPPKYRTNEMHNLYEWLDVLLMVDPEKEEPQLENYITRIVMFAEDSKLFDNKDECLNFFRKQIDTKKVKNLRKEREEEFKKERRREP